MTSRVPEAAGKPARAALKAATEATHLRMHGLQAFVAIEEGRLGRSAYGDLLLSLHSFHRAVDARIAAGVRPLTTCAARLERLERDLESLGLAPAPEPSGRREAPAGEAESLGYAYVAQGSVLGGAVIARQLDYLLGEGRDGRRFFQPTREDALAWRRLGAALERKGRDRQALAAMVAGAEAAFDLFERYSTPAAPASAVP